MQLPSVFEETCPTANKRKNMTFLFLEKKVTNVGYNFTYYAQSVRPLVAKMY